MYPGQAQDSGIYEVMQKAHFHGGSLTDLLSPVQQHLASSKLDWTESSGLLTTQDTLSWQMLVHLMFINMRGLKKSTL